MFEVLRVQAVAQSRPQVERTETRIAQTNIKLSHVPKDLSSFLDFVPLGFELEAYVKKATRDEVVLRLRFMGREIEITVKNLLGIEFKPNQRVVLTLIDRNPYVFKLSLPLVQSYKIFSRIRNFFKSPLPSVLKSFLNFTELPMGIRNSGLFYEHKVVRYLLGQETPESLRFDLKYKLLSLINNMGFIRPKYQLFVKPFGRFVKGYNSFPLWKINLTNFINAYAAFYELSPTSVENLIRFIYLSQVRLKKRYPSLFKEFKAQKREIDKPIFFAPLEGTLRALNLPRGGLQPPQGDGRISPIPPRLEYSPKLPKGGYTFYLPRQEILYGNLLLRWKEEYLPPVGKGIGKTLLHRG